MNRNITATASAVATPPVPGTVRWGLWVLCAIVAAYIILFISIYLHFRSIPEYWNAWAGTWNNLFVLPLLPTFADLRTITNGTECWMRGIDVYIADPCDPWGRPTNYPPIWLHVFGYLGVDHGTTKYIAAGFALCFLVAAVGFFGARRRGWHGLAYGLVMISPPIGLGIERGNNDIFMFALIVAGLSLAFRRRLAAVAATGFLVAATVLKLYPVFSAAILLTRRPTAIIIAVVTALAGAVYFITNAHYLAYVSANTGRGIILSYGAEVAFNGLARDYDWPGLRAWALPVLGVVAVAACAFGLGLARRQVLALAQDRWGGGFATGAAIYLFSFAIAPSWDYRLCFLLLCVPQILDWISEVAAPARQRSVAATLMVVLLAAFHLSRWSLDIYYIDEIFNWGMFFLLGAIMTANGWRGVAEGYRAARGLTAR